MYFDTSYPSYASYIYWNGSYTQTLSVTSGNFTTLPLVYVSSFTHTAPEFSIEPPKNWRWYHKFFSFVTYLVAKQIVPCLNTYKKQYVGLSILQKKRAKRKAYIVTLMRV